MFMVVIGGRLTHPYNRTDLTHYLEDHSEAIPVYPLIAVMSVVGPFETATDAYAYARRRNKTQENNNTRAYVFEVGTPLKIDAGQIGTVRPPRKGSP